MRTWGPGRYAPAQQEQADLPRDDPQMDRVVRRYFWFYAISAVPCWLLTIAVGLMLVTVFPLKSSFIGVLLGMFVLLPVSLWAVISSLAAWGMARRRPVGYLAHWAAILCMLPIVAWGIQFRVDIFLTPLQEIQVGMMRIMLSIIAAAFVFLVFATPRALQPRFRRALLGRNRTTVHHPTGKADAVLSRILWGSAMLGAATFLYPTVFPTMVPPPVPVSERLAVLSQAIERNPADIASLLERAVAWTLCSPPEWEKCRQDYRAVLALDPNNLKALYYLASAYSHDGDVPAAIETWSKVISVSPDDSTAYQKRGELYLGQQKYDLAIADFESAHPKSQGFWCHVDHAEAYYRRGSRRYDEGNKQEAIADLQRALDIKAITWKERRQAELLLKRWRMEDERK